MGFLVTDRILHTGCHKEFLVTDRILHTGCHEGFLVTDRILHTGCHEGFLVTNRILHTGCHEGFLSPIESCTLVVIGGFLSPIESSKQWRSGGKTLGLYLVMRTNCMIRCDLILWESKMTSRVSCQVSPHDIRYTRASQLSAGMTLV